MASRKIYKNKSRKLRKNQKKIVKNKSKKMRKQHKKLVKNKSKKRNKRGGDPDDTIVTKYVKYLGKGTYKDVYELRYTALLDFTRSTQRDDEIREEIKLQQEIQKILPENVNNISDLQFRVADKFSRFALSDLCDTEMCKLTEFHSMSNDNYAKFIINQLKQEIHYTLCFYYYLFLDSKLENICFKKNKNGIWKIILLDFDTQFITKFDQSSYRVYQFLNNQDTIKILLYYINYSLFLFYALKYKTEILKGCINGTDFVNKIKLELNSLFTEGFLLGLDVNTVLFNDTLIENLEKSVYKSNNFILQNTNASISSLEKNIGIFLRLINLIKHEDKNKYSPLYMFLHYFQRDKFEKYINSTNIIKILSNFTIRPHIAAFKGTTDLINELKNTLISLITS